MFHSLWKTPLPGGVIDCHYDATRRTLVVGDTVGNVALLDQAGKPIADLKCRHPVWGVSHAYTDDGSIYCAVAQGRKPSHGRASLFRDFELLHEYEDASPCWDSIVLPAHKAAIFTFWSGKIVICSFDEKAAPRCTAKLPAPAFGIADCRDSGNVVICVERTGLFQLSADDGSVNEFARCPDASYNVAIAQGLVLAGGTAGSAHLLRGSVARSFQLPGKSVSSVAIAGPYVVVGDLDGNIVSFWPTESRQAVAVLTLPGGVWHLQYETNESLLFAACADGQVHCFYVDVETPGAKQIDKFLSLGAREIRNKLPRLSSSIPPRITAMQLERHWSDLKNEKRIERVLRDLVERGNDDRARYLLGIWLLEHERAAEAIECLQTIDSDSHFYLKALSPLADAFKEVGALNSAIRVLRANTHRVSAGEAMSVAYKLGALHEEKGDRDSALECYELCASQDWNFKDVRDRIQALRERAPGLVVPNPPLPDVDVSLVTEGSAEEKRPSVLGSGRRRSNYDLFFYWMYELGPPADEAKKHLEFDLVDRALRDCGASGGASLDIGCATGRWPLWFSRRGYLATGFDISEASIALCQQRAEQIGDTTVAFEQRNIVEDTADIGPFEVVTCMMGTFNHIPREASSRLLDRVSQALVPGGCFLFTMWNVRSPFTDFLQLDSERAKVDLRDNALSVKEISDLMDSGAWDRVDVQPFCMLPNSCYDVWEDDFSDVRQLLELETHLKKFVAPEKAQMLFVTAVRK